MADFYANLSVETYPGSAGTVADPYGWTEFIAGVNLAVGVDVFYLRGTRVLDANWGPTPAAPGVDFMAWDLALYGPWRIYGDGAYDYNDGTDAITLYDGIIICERIYAFDGLRMYYDLNDATSGLHDQTDCTIVYRTAFTGEASPNAFLRCSFYSVNGDTVAGTFAACTVTNSAISVANWAAFAGANMVDGGGQLYNVTPPSLPAWNDADLQNFSLSPLRGVGYPGVWACPDPLYVNVTEAYDDTFPRNGTAALPLDWGDVTGDLFNNGASICVPNQRVRVTGLRTLIAAGVWDPAQAGIEVYGWDGGSGDTEGFFGITSSPGFIFRPMSGGSPSVDYRRMFMNNDELIAYAGAAGTVHRFRGCGLLSDVSANLELISVNTNQNIYFDGCTLKHAGRLLFTEVGGGGTIWNFRYCLIETPLAQIDAGEDVTASFYKCRFTVTSQAVFEAASAAGKLEFTDCEFGVDLSQDIPPVDELTVAGLLYWPYELYLKETVSASDVAYWETNDFNEGLGGESRYGVGAFYFDVPQAEGTATPTEGSAPLDVRFSTDPETDVDVQWDFNDGTYSEEWQVSKRYAAAGKYEVTLTWTDWLGNTTTRTFTIYVYDWDYTGSGPWASYTDECLRLSMKPAKGLGWSEFNGDGWPFPEARVGPLKIIDDSNRERQLVLDSIWGRVVEIGKTEGFKDLAGGYDEQDISTEIRFPEEIGEAEHYFLESLEHHAHFRPFSEDDGYLDDFAVDFSLLKDGAQSDTLKTQEIPLNGDVVLRPQDEAHRWQPRIVTTTSGYRLVRLRDYYVVRDKAAAPGDRVMTEQDWEGELGNVLMHMGRNELNPVLNFATGADFTGSYSSTVTGPDGRDDSALAFAGSGLASADSLSLTGDFTICGWVNNIGTTQTIMSQASGFRVRVVVGTGYTLEYRDGSGTYTSTAMSWGGSGWVMLTIVRSGRTLSMYQDDTLLFSQEISVATNTGVVQLFPSSTGYGFDMKVINGALEAGAVEYHHRDVTKKDGVSTCPLF